MDCEQVEREELVEKYLSGRLEPPLERDLQVHLLECRECLALLETCEAARDELAAQAAELPANQARGSRPGWQAWFVPWRVAAFTGLGIAVIVTAVIAVRTRVISRRTPQVQNGGTAFTGSTTTGGTEANFPELAALSSTEQAAVSQAIGGRMISYPADLGALRGKTGTLLGSSTSSSPEARFQVLEPLGEVVIDASPVFRWQTLAGAGSYSVDVFDSNTNPVQSGSPRRAPQWKPPRPLKRGQTYEWQVTAAMRDGKSVIAPSFPQPKAKFRVLDEAKANELEQFRQAHPDSHLILGILYAQAGVLKTGERELAQVPANSRDFDLAQHLLHSLRESR
jgi:hypothetical protein